MNNKCITCSNRYVCDEEYEFQCKSNDYIAYKNDYNSVKNLDVGEPIKPQHTEQKISFNFVYDTPEELFKTALTISKVFDLDYETLQIDPNEKMGSIEIPTINKQLFDVLNEYYDDSIKVMYISDDILIGSEKSFDEMGL